MDAQVNVRQSVAKPQPASFRPAVQVSKSSSREWRRVRTLPAAWWIRYRDSSDHAMLCYCANIHWPWSRFHFSHSCWCGVQHRHMQELSAADVHLQERSVHCVSRHIGILPSNKVWCGSATYHCLPCFTCLPRLRLQTSVMRGGHPSPRRFDVVSHWFFHLLKIPQHSSNTWEVM